MRAIAISALLLVASLVSSAVADVWRGSAILRSRDGGEQLFELRFDVGPDGRATGALSGGLGDLPLSGAASETQVRLTFSDPSLEIEIGGRIEGGTASGNGFAAMPQAGCTGGEDCLSVRNPITWEATSTASRLGLDGGGFGVAPPPSPAASREDEVLALARRAVALARSGDHPLVAEKMPVIEELVRRAYSDPGAQVALQRYVEMLEERERATATPPGG